MTSAGPGDAPPPPNPGAAKWRRWLKILMAVLTAAFVGWAGIELGSQWNRSEPIDLNIGWAVAAVLPTVGIAFFQAWGWVILIRAMSGRAVPARSGMELFLASMLGRYAPAKLGMPVILAAGASRFGLGPAVMLSSMMLIVLTYTVVGTVVAFAVVVATGGALPGDLAAFVERFAIWAVTLSAVATVALATVDRRRLPAMLLRLCRIDGGRGPVVPWSVVLCYAAVWGCWLLHGFALAQAVGATVPQAWAGSAYFVLAPLAGFLALVAPGGIGVREAVIAGGLLGAVGPAAATVAALLSRTISLGIDAAAWLLARRLRGRIPEPPNSPDTR